MTLNKLWLSTSTLILAAGLITACSDNGADSYTKAEKETELTAEASAESHGAPSDTADTPSPQAEMSQVAAAIAAIERPVEDTSRDAMRKPVDVIEFLGIGEGDIVADMEPGGGYYTRMLSAVVGDEGKVYGMSSTFVANRFPQAIEAMNGLAAETPNIETSVSRFDETDYPENLDAAIMVLFYHDLYNFDWDRDRVNQRIYDALKPGGVYVIIDHHSAEGAPDEVTETLHRGQSERIKSEILKAGFEFAGESDVLAHSEDDHTKNVFDPSIRGKTDRFIYKFKKPEA